MAKRRIDIDIEVKTEMDKILGRIFLESIKTHVKELLKEHAERQMNLGKPIKEINKHKMI